jgi:hypothetical protein
LDGGGHFVAFLGQRFQKTRFNTQRDEFVHSSSLSLCESARAPRGSQPTPTRAKNRGLRRTPRVLPGQFRMIWRSKGIDEIDLDLGPFTRRERLSKYAFVFQQH